MLCPLCSNPNTKVLDSRVASEGKSIRRRRECSECKFRFTTYEKIASSSLIIDKKDGEKEQFDRDKLFSSIKKACSKLAIEDPEIDSLVTKIEGILVSKGTESVNSQEIGEITVSELREFNPIAYVRYASVFGDVTSITQFENIVEFAKNKVKGSKKIESKHRIVNKEEEDKSSNTKSSFESKHSSEEDLQELYDTPAFLRENKDDTQKKSTPTKNRKRKPKTTPPSLFQ